MPGLSVLFWNLNDRPLAPRVARLAASLGTDVVILAECADAPAVVTELNAGCGGYAEVLGCGGKLRVFTRLPAGSAQILVLDPLDAWVGLILTPPCLPTLTLFAAHLPSKLRAGGYDQLLTSAELARDIDGAELGTGHARTILVGDLNANPFEPSVVWAGGLHGLMTRQLAALGERTIRGRVYRVFYNPMWGFFGDRTAGPPGTYFRSSSESVNYFWNTYDQVLLRPELIDRLTDLRILESDGTDSLLTWSGRPDDRNGSDHLPLYFRLDW